MEESESTSNRPSTSTIVLWSVLGIVVAGAVGLCVAATVPRGSVSGDIRSSADPLGDFVIRPITCYSGDHWGFDGVWVVTETRTIGDRTGFQGGLKIEADESGRWTAIVENPNRCEVFTCEKTPLTASRCPVLELKVERAHTLWRYSGSARIECEFPEGGSLRADLVFDRCGWVPGGS